MIFQGFGAAEYGHDGVTDVLVEVASVVKDAGGLAIQQMIDQGHEIGW